MSDNIPTNPTVLRILLADDHSFIREGLKGLIGKQSDMEVVGEANDGQEAVSKAAEYLPDIVVMDVTMPRMSGMQATKQIKKAHPRIKVLGLSMHEDTSYLRGLLEAGASGYVLKRSAPQELIQALRSVAEGNTYLDPAVAARAATVFISKTPLRGEVAGAALSERENAVIRLVALGYTNREIAERIDLSVKTAETYRARAMEKLGFSTRADLVRHAAVLGWFGEN